MKEQHTTFWEKMKVAGWSFRQAWKMDKRILLIWYGLSALLSLLPAISLIYNQKIIDALSGYISTGSGAFDMVLPYIITLGLIMVAIGLSARINRDLIYLVMYDSYYLGIQELVIEYTKRVDIETLQDKDTINEYSETSQRAASLVDFMSSTCELMAKLINIISLLIVAVRNSPLIFAISLVYVIGVLILNQNYVEKVRQNNWAMREQYKRTEYYEKLPKEPNTAKEIRIFGNKDVVLDQWRTANNKIMDYEKEKISALSKRSFISGLVFYLFVIVMIGSAIFEVYHGAMTPALLLILFTMCTNMYVALGGLMTTMMRAYDGLFFLGLQRDMFNRYPAPKVQDGITVDSAVDTVFKVDHISFSYMNGFQAIDDVSFEVHRGEVIALIGENGSGKTTLVKLLLGLFQPFEGSLTFMDKPYTERSYDWLRKHIGVYFQDSMILHKTIRDNIGYGDVEHIWDDARILEAAQKGGADMVLEKLPKGLDTILGRRVETEGVELSGGEKQRMGVARSYMMDKEVMILDEPAAALDPLAELHQYETVKDEIQGRTAILISHRIGFARMADRIIVMDAGKVKEIGTHEELIVKNGLYAEMFRTQSQWYETEEVS